jgi:hypothetical protein
MYATDEPDESDILRRLRATPGIIELLGEASNSGLGLQKQLRAEFPSDVVRAALTLVDLRRKAAGRFSRADQMWFDPTGLEQATAEPVALHKAKRFTGRVHDFCCGIGSDMIAMARSGCQVTGVDLDPATCLRAEWNAECYEVVEQVSVVAADVLHYPAQSGLLHVDPDRRPGPGRRVLKVEECVPGLGDLLHMMRAFSGGAIKLSPASNFGGKFPGCEVELISLQGECKEATIWFGDLRGESEFRATVLPAGETLAADPLSAWTNVGPLGRWLYDPDPSIVRAGLVDVLAERLGLHRLDDAEEYLTGDELVESPFVAPFEVVEDLPNNPKEIRRAVRQGDYGQAEIKCRHVPVKAEEIRRKLPLNGSKPVSLIYTRQGGRTRVVLCHRPQRRP